MKILKPRLSNIIGMIFGGYIISNIGFCGARVVGRYLGIIPGIFGMLGLLLLCTGVASLVRRKKSAIIIDNTGNKLPAFNVFQRHSPKLKIAREDIAMISIHESIKGRLIEIKTKDDKNIYMQARHYCKLKEFISHCRDQGFNVT